MPTKQELAEEQKKMRKLRILVDFTTAVLYQGDYDAAEGLAIIQATRERVLELFPDKGDTFDLIYKPRFQRIVNQKLNVN